MIEVSFKKFQKFEHKKAFNFCNLIKELCGSSRNFSKCISKINDAIQLALTRFTTENNKKLKKAKICKQKISLRKQYAADKSNCQPDNLK